MSIPVEIVGKSQDLTDWIVVAAAAVQAVGSVAAIFAAVWITDRDRAKTRREARGQRISALASIIFKAEDLIRSPYLAITGEPPALYQEVFTGDAWESQVREIDQCLRILTSAPVHDFEWELASAVMEMEAALVGGRAELFALKEQYKAALLYPAMPQAMTADNLRKPVNLAAKASARLHQLAHSNSAEAWVRKYRIQPATV